MAYVAGYSGTVTVNSVAFPTIDATITEKNRLGETTNSSTAGRATWLGTVSEADFSCGVVFDDAALLTTITVGSSLSYSGKIGNSSKTFSGTVIVESFEYQWDNRQGVVIQKITGKFSGSITRPS